MNDGTAPTEDGCTAMPTGSLSGKIVLIRRGTCNFVDKVSAAESAGALAVIMMNNVTGGPITMGGTDTGVGIPSIMISKEDGDLLMANLTDLNGTLKPYYARGSLQVILFQGFSL